MEKRNHELEKAGLAIPEILAAHRLLTPYKLFKVKQHWAAIVGPQIAKYSYVLDFQEHSLTIGVLNPVWMNQLFMYKNKIIKNINEFIHEQAIRDIRFVRSGRKPPAIVYDTLQGEEAGTAPTIPIRKVILANEVVAKIQEDTRQLPPRLQERVAQLRFAQAKRQQAYGQSGFHQCPRCGRWLAKGESLCFLCRLQERQEQKQRIHDILADMPWLTWQDMVQHAYVPAASKRYETLYHEVRRDFIYRYIEKIRYDADTLGDDLALAMFITRKKPAELEPAFIQHLTEKYRRKDHVSSHQPDEGSGHGRHRGPHPAAPDTAP